MKNRKPSFISKYITDQKGGIAIIFAVSLMVILGAVGGAIDFGMATIARSKLSGAIDSATLSAAVAPTSENRMNVARRYYEANYNDGYLGTDIDFNKLNIDINDVDHYVDVQVTGTTRVNSILKLSGLDKIPVNTRSTAGIESTSANINDKDIALILDESGSMLNANTADGALTRLEAARNALTKFSNDLIPYDYADPMHNPNLRIGMVKFSSQLKNKYALTSNKDTFQGYILAGVAPDWPDGTCGACGFRAANEMLNNNPGPATPRSDALIYSPVRMTVLLSDGGFTRTINDVPGDPVIAGKLECQALKASGVIVYTIAFGDVILDPHDIGGKETLKECASIGPDGLPYYYEAPDAVELNHVFEVINTKISKIRLIR